MLQFKYCLLGVSFGNSLNKLLKNACKFGLSNPKLDCYSEPTFNPFFPVRIYSQAQIGKPLPRQRAGREHNRIR